MSGDNNTTNPWPAIAESAREGVLKFEDGVALRAANRAADAIGGVRAIRAVAETMDNMSRLSDQDSGEALALQFSGRAVELARILDKHIDILEDLVETFVAAGKMYAAAEAENEAAFDDIAVPSDPTEISGPPPVYTHIPGWVLFPGDAVPAGVLYSWESFGFEPNPHGVEEMTERLQEFEEFVPSTIMVEHHADAMTYEDLYRFGRSILSQTAANWSGQWWWLADQIEDVFSSLLNQINSITEDKWEGTGKERAVTAVREYATSVPMLARNVRLVGDNLSYTSSWLYATQASMPKEYNNPAGADLDPDGIYGSGRIIPGEMVNDPTPAYRQNMKDTYLRHLPVSAESIPTLPYPEASFSGDNNGSVAEEDRHGAADGGSTGAVGMPGAGQIMMPADLSGASRDYAAQSSAAQQAIGASTGLPAGQVADAGGAAGTQAEPTAQAGQQAAQQMLQQAGQLAQQMGQEAANAARQAGQQALPAGLPPGALSGPNASRSAGIGSSTAGGAARGAGVGSSPARSPSEASKLFPRANANTVSGAAPGRAGFASSGFPSSGMAPAGTPGSPGAAAGRGTGQDKGGDYKRPAFLDSVENLDEGLGAEPRAARPVVEQ
ncbi:hypothetical protein [Nocardia sp. NBC_00416]|uniref:hypothetical protein n=1 Tax=Nocardia sp. NBC_00416 TaxID=2975991 RepID=UPI002E1C2C10